MLSLYEIIVNLNVLCQCGPLSCVKVNTVCGCYSSCPLLSSAPALDKHEKIGRYGFTSLGITEVRMYVHIHMCTTFICVVLL